MPLKKNAVYETRNVFESMKYFYLFISIVCLLSPGKRKKPKMNACTRFLKYSTSVFTFIVCVSMISIFNLYMIYIFIY